MQHYRTTAGAARWSTAFNEFVPLCVQKNYDEDAMNVNRNARATVHATTHLQSGELHVMLYGVT
jgi:hypothetical protein